MFEDPIPALRSIEVVSIQHEGRDLYLMRDPQGIAAEAILLPPASAALLRFFDGRHSVADIQVAVTRATGEIVPRDQISSFVNRLDACLFLDSEAYRTRRREIAAAYAALPQRPARFAGEAYSADRSSLLQELDATYLEPGGPGMPDAPVRQLPRAIAAPHIDPGRGGGAYAQAYASIWGGRPRRVVVLGISHAGGDQPFVLTTKDYTTPLGVARTDRTLIERLAGRLDWDPCQDEELHRSEHSIEFQVAYLQHAFSCGGSCEPDNEPLYVPVLCTFPWETFHPASPAGTSARLVQTFLTQLSDLLAQEADDPLFVAGVDLAHIGRRFGDDFPLTETFLADLRRRDLTTLTLLAEGDRNGFLAEILQENDNRRICGFSALYCLLTLLPDVTGKVVGYHQAIDQAANSVVTVAGLVFTDRG